MKGTKAHAQVDIYMWINKTMHNSRIGKSKSERKKMQTFFYNELE